MKRFNQLNLILLAAFSVIMLACEDPVDPPNSPVSEKQSVKVKGTFHTFSPTHTYNNPAASNSDLSYFQATGQIQLDALDEDWMEVRHSHIAILRDDERIEFLNGEFYFEGSNDDSFFGTYEGSGKKFAAGFNAEFLLTVKGGTGKYTEATGRLREVIQLQKGNGNSVYDIYFNGDISLPDEVQLTKIYM